ncbi:uncharacterized protein BT62DRAFT_1011074 [Guyanagaster necrorhizus]|uniref:Uncharacterized protein n=1 Tax=Guyanagaster necrorhizus TaxID=856835 RepID=A0A9P7VKW4_9AGAR|nr:uncharacterized protein BT62DRAFT_1011074 [Guyanagaster necrorhizus MCA 3950]KAG7441779.1 hypothetical protein BT62DRAFT_1011074 [Guyanagaster necrorhizus MCA 3950]
MDAAPGNIDAFEFAPKLKTLHLTNMHAGAEVSFPAHNLVSFLDGRKLPDNVTTINYLDIVASAPNILYFSYHHHSPIPESSGPYSRHIINSSLRTLSASLGSFLSSIVLPALKEMTLTSGCPNYHTVSSEPIICPEDALSHLHALIIRSQCSLTVLRFVDATMDDNLIPILQLSPQLVTLVFEYNAWSSTPDNIMETFVLKMSEITRVGAETYPVLLPCLKELEFYVDDIEFESVDFLNTDFVDMISSRLVVQQGGQILKSLVVVVIGRAFYVPFQHQGGIQALERLRDNGLDLHLDLDDYEDRVLEASTRICNPEDE